MKNYFKLLMLFVPALLMTACDQDENQLVPENDDLQAGEQNYLLEEQEILDVLELENNQADARRGVSSSVVYTLSNESSGNRVIAFQMTGEGMLEEMDSYPTGGYGTDGGLGNQGALALSNSGRLLFAVNAASNEISAFFVRRDGSLYLIDTAPSAGEMPISITSHRGLIYVLNAGGTGNIAGFAFNWHGELVNLPGSNHGLSSDAAGGAQISFAPNGRSLIVTEKATNMITSYPIGRWGIARAGQSYPSAGITPFGFTFGNSNVFFVSEAAGGAAEASTVSSYTVSNDGTVALVDGPFATNGTAACWVAATTNGRQLFVTNTGSDDISSLKVQGRGMIGFDNGGMTTPSFDGPIDAIVDRGSKYLFTLTGANDAIHTYRIGANGSLTATDVDAGLPIGTTGLVVR